MNGRLFWRITVLVKEDGRRIGGGNRNIIDMIALRNEGVRVT